MTLILPEEDFRAELNAERACAIRGGYPAHLLLFDVGESAPHGAGQTRFEVALHRALREIDVVGWSSGKQVGVILPGSDEAGAKRVAERLSRDVFTDSPEPSLRSCHDSDDDALVAALSADANRRPRLRHSQRSEGSLVASDPAGVLRLIARPLPRWKRAVDVIVAGGGLLLCAPVMLGIALLVKLTSPGGVIFRQERTGRHLRRFQILKFRTMRTGSELRLRELQGLNQMSGPLFKSDTDPRLTPIGRFLRRTSLDELPQLVNVLRGDMTLLGPRALSPQPAAYEPWQLRRFAVTPGLACEWQATRRGETDFEAWMRSDLRYVGAGPSAWRDLWLLLRTGVAVLSCAGGR